MSTPPGLVAITVLTGIFGVFLALLLVLDKLKPSQGAGWGPLGFQFPREWALVWIGYWFMLVFTIFVFPFIMAGLPGFGVGGSSASAGEAVETIIALGPFLHCMLMPVFWYRTHRRNAKVVPGEPPKTPELDPDAKTIIFSMKMKFGDKVIVLLVSLIFGLIAKVLWLVKTVSFGALNFEGFWFPAPFFKFWEVCLHTQAALTPTVAHNP